MRRLTMILPAVLFSLVFSVTTPSKTAGFSRCDESSSPFSASCVEEAFGIPAVSKTPEPIQPVSKDAVLKNKPRQKNAAEKKNMLKCQKPAAEYLKEAEQNYSNTPEYPTTYNTERGVKTVAGALLYQICSQLEQNE